MAVSQDIVELVFRSDTTGINQADAGTQKYIESLNRLETESDQATTATRRLDTALKGKASSSEAATRATVELTRGFQDLSAAGLYGISNNIEGITLALKGLFADGIIGGLKTLAGAMLGPAGIITAFTLLTTVGPKLASWIGDFLNSLDPDPLKNLEERLAAFRKEAEGTGKDLQAMAEKVKAAFQSDVEQESSKRVADLLRNDPQAAAAREQLEQRELQRKAQADPQYRVTRSALEEIQQRITQTLASDPGTPQGREAQRWQVRDLEAEKAKIEEKLQSRMKELRGGAMQEVQRMFASSTAADQRVLMQDLNSLGFAGLAQGIQERGVGAVRGERTREAAAKAIEKIKEGMQRAASEQARVNEARQRAEEKRQAAADKATEMTAEEADFFAEAAKSGKRSHESRVQLEQEAKKAAAQQQRDRERLPFLLDELAQQQLRLEQKVNDLMGLQMQGAGMTLQGHQMMRQDMLDIQHLRNLIAQGSRDLSAIQANAMTFRRSGLNRNH